MLLLILIGAFLTLALFVGALIIAMAIRKTKAGKRKLFIAHRILAISGTCFAVIHAVLAYNYFIYKFF